MHLTQSRLIELLEYDPDSGRFMWRATGPGRRRKEAGSAPNKGNPYRRIQVDGVLYYAHRLAYLYMTGEMPEVVDHRDGDESNCRWENLRASSGSDNGKNVNRRGYHQSKSGRFVAQLTTDYRTEHIGTFDTPDEARAAYVQAKAASHAAWITGQGSSA